MSSSRTIPLVLRHLVMATIAFTLTTSGAKNCAAAEEETPGSKTVETAEKQTWGKKEFILEGVADGLLVVDWLQTNYTVKEMERDRNAHRAYSYRESNPLLGKHPDRADVHLYFGSLLVAKGLAAYLLPKNWNNVLNVIVIAVETMAVIHNVNVGASLSF